MCTVDYMLYSGCHTFLMDPPACISIAHNQHNAAVCPLTLVGLGDAPKDAVLQASAATSDGDAPLDVSHALYGHLVYEKEGQVAVAPDPV